VQDPAGGHPFGGFVWIETTGLAGEIGQANGCRASDDQQRGDGDE
jgi:hypothetical protein